MGYHACGYVVYKLVCVCMCVCGVYWCVYTGRVKGKKGKKGHTGSVPPVNIG